MPPLWEVKEQEVPPLWEVKWPTGAHLTRPSVGTEGVANHVAQPPHQYVAVLGVYRDGQPDTGEVTPTAQLTSAASPTYVATLGPP